uniref:C2H2-type domain-containing protein n=1 Tax=Anopheles atroparvus TaxID=41427 RepID=A0AAG5DA71_ANOAO
MDMEPCTEFKMESLESFEPLVNPIRQYRNRSKRTLKTGEEKLAEVLAKIASLQKNSEKTDGIDRTKVRTYNVKLRLKKSHLYKCFDCGNCFANPDFLELHEKSHAEQGKCNIDLCQEPVEAEMSLKQNAWFVGDFGENDEYEDGEHIVQLDCTVEEGEEIFDITFDRTKCEKTYTMKYKVKKEPVGKCEHCAKQFYSAECWKLHELEHEKFLDITNVEPSINIMQSPKIEESTMTLDESFYEGLDVSDILERSSGTIDCMTDGRLAAGAGITFEYRIIPRRSFSGDGKDADQPKDRQGHKRPASAGEEPVAAKVVNQSVCQPTVRVKEEVMIKEEPIEEQTTIDQVFDHVAVKHEVMEQDEQPPAKQMRVQTEHQCTICSKRFHFLAALQVHERTHSGARPYSCRQCSKSFISKGKRFLHSYSQHRNRNKGLSCCKCQGSLRHLAICEHYECQRSDSVQ